MGIAFCREWVYLDSTVADVITELPEFFPAPDVENFGIMVASQWSMYRPGVFMTGNLNMYSAQYDCAWFIPRWVYVPESHGFRRVDNVTAEIVAHYRDQLDSPVTSDEIYHYGYGALHDREVSSRWAEADLDSFSPELPEPSGYAEFVRVSVLGRELAAVHRRQQGADPLEMYPLEVHFADGVDTEGKEVWQTEGLRWADDEHTSIIYSPKVTITGIPPEADRYRVGSRSAMDWLMLSINRMPPENLRMHLAGEPTFLIDFLRSLTTMCVESVRILEG